MCDREIHKIARKQEEKEVRKRKQKERNKDLKLESVDSESDESRLVLRLLSNH